MPSCHESKRHHDNSLLHVHSSELIASQASYLKAFTDDLQYFTCLFPQISLIRYLLMCLVEDCVVILPRLATNGAVTAKTLGDNFS